MPQTPYCTSLAISPKENVVAVGFESPIVRFFSTSKSEPPREDHLHSRYHDECKEKECPPIGTLSFSNDGLTVLASIRSLKNGMISFYSWHHPFESFQEESKCRYHVALHESEDNGVTSAIYRPKSETEASLICVTTWTLSGTPLLIQSSDGQKIDIRTDRSGHYGQLGSRIQSAAFSGSGNELAIVNARGHVYYVANLDSNPLDPRRIATSLELTKKEGFFAMTYMTLPEEEAIVLAWADSNKALGYIKKIPTKSRVSSARSHIRYSTLTNLPHLARFCQFPQPRSPPYDSPRSSYSHPLRAVWRRRTTAAGDERARCGSSSLYREGARGIRRVMADVPLQDLHCTNADIQQGSGIRRLGIARRPTARNSATCLVPYGELSAVLANKQSCRIFPSGHDPFHALARQQGLDKLGIDKRPACENADYLAPCKGPTSISLPQHHA